jgi:hypothetical protein
LFKTRRRRTAAVLAGILGFSALAYAIPNASANIAGSTFEGGDGNFVVNTSGNTDWAALNAQQTTNLSVQPDLLSGQTDNSFGNGTKTDSNVVSVVSGQIPNNKADLGNSYITSEEINGDTYLYLGVTRVTVSGTVNLDIEINQLAQPDLTTPGAKTLNRVGNGVDDDIPDDILIGYDFQGGAQKPTLSFRRWNSAGNGSWSSPVAISATNGESEVNRVDLANPLAVAPSPALAPAFTFGEAAINLSGLGLIEEGDCSPFSSAYVKSRASDAFNSAVKDFIAPQDISLDNCSTLTFAKVTDPDTDTTTEFDFEVNGAGIDDPNTPADEGNFSLVNGGSTTFGGLSPGSFTAEEVNLPTGWDLETFTCDNGDDASDITLGANEDVTCTATNLARAELHIVKDAERPGVDFSFTAASPLSPATFELADGEQQDFADLVPGTYDVSEDGEANWTNTSATCDNGDTPDAVTLEPGDDVTCTFVNVVNRGSVLIHKTAKQQSAPGHVINHAGVSFRVTNGNGTDSTVVTDASGNACVANVPVSALDGSYTVTETVPAGYHSEDDVQDYSVVSGTTCATATPLEFVNIPLTDVTVSVDSQIDGGTASTIDCVSASTSTGANGDGSLELNDLEPQTLVCTVVIDP